MNEFELIDKFFKAKAKPCSNLIVGIGDDAACIDIPSGYQLLVSTDTLVANVHFLDSWDAYFIAWKAVMVNISDIVAMGGEPKWISLALTLPKFDLSWLKRFSEGLSEALGRYNISLIGGDTTAGPLSLTITIHGLVPKGKAITRKGAKAFDLIWVSGELGAAAQAVAFLNSTKVNNADREILEQKLQNPQPRTDLVFLLQKYASAAIDISDGLSADLNHICKASNLGAKLFFEAIPIHPLVKKYQQEKALQFAIAGGDDYELCFTTSAKNADQNANLEANNCVQIGYMETNPGLRVEKSDGSIYELEPKGYSHF